MFDNIYENVYGEWIINGTNLTFESEKEAMEYAKENGLI